MRVRVAIPEPSIDPEYNGRSLPPYLEALKASGALPVVIPVGESGDRVRKTLEGVQGVLLPGSRFDVDPESYGEPRIPQCNVSDPARAALDELLLRDAFNQQKPILAICYGIQALNVWCEGTLVQHLQTQVNHSPGRDVVGAHGIQVTPGTRLASLLSPSDAGSWWVNSSHHQAVKQVGPDLAVTAISPVDGVIEAVELASSRHFVLGVQWHPERTYSVDPLSRAIFSSFVEAAQSWQPRPLSEAVASHSS